ncbi:ParA family protein [Adlercreutzia agrestimuris]|uniref:ParA family protein n=1 Tax=Adlercreutzia agrestimuris TaxID=2941324 RepID=UPI002042407A|nr:ParA family protein [Adlercreutzia agrestimuris]
MKTILLCNQKGGVGKSLIADELAFSLERSGIPLDFYDLDAQGGTLHTTTKAEGAEVTVVDTPGALQEGMSDWVSAADLVVIPTRPTTRDMDPLLRMVDIVKAHKDKKVLYVVNGWNRYRASRDFVQWFEGVADNDIVLKLPQSEKFVQSAAAGQSVVEYAPQTKAAKATQELIDKIRTMAGVGKEG